MKTKLVFPAFWTCSAPYLSVPSLVAYLKAHGKEVEQIDLNLEFTDRILSKDFLKFCLTKHSNSTDNSNQKYIPYLDAIGKYVYKNIEEQKVILRSETALDILVYEKCCNFIAMGFSIVNAAFPDEIINLNSYKSAYDIDSFHSILQSSRDAYAETNGSLVQLLTSYFIDDLTNGTDLIGISLTGLNQIIPAFVLAGMIKRKNRSIRIVIGGSIPTRWFADQRNLPNIFEFVDYVIVNEGEEPLVALIDYIEGKIPIDKIPQLYYLDDSGKVTFNDLSVDGLDICSFPTPIFNKTDINRYLSPVPTLPLLGCRGCYWCKCTFCDHSFVYNNNYRPANIDKLILDIRLYISEYNVRHINFHDEAMVPNGLLELSKRLISERIDIKWSTDARLDRGLTYDILDTAHEAGLSILFFGLESINNRIINLMKKGTHTNVTERILFDAKTVGIGSHCFFICGFPTETIEEYQETVNFISKNKEIIAFHGCSKFSLGKHSPIAKNPEKYQIRILDKNNDDSASLYYRFERTNVNSSFEERQNNVYQKVTKDLFTYAQKVLYLLFRDHWIIFWNDIEETLRRVSEITSNYPLKSGVFLIDTDDNLLVFDCETSNVFEFHRDTKFLFSLIEKNGAKGLDKIIQEVSRHFCVPQLEAENEVSEFVSLLIENNLIVMPSITS